MTWIKPFSEISKDDAAIAGGKGASLGEMTQAGIPVPEGFVLLATAFESFFEKTSLATEVAAILKTVRAQDMKTIEHASEQAQSLILQKEIPEDIVKEIEKEFSKLGAEFVAVRSSATAEDSAEAAWAGQLDTFLNTTKDTLLENVRRCWASLFTPRAIFYRIEKGLLTAKISVAVVIQKMVQSEVSGVAFSVHPVTEDRNQMIIEAGFGLGEAIVSGQITPDSYVITKIPFAISDKNIYFQKQLLRKAKGVGNEWHELNEKAGSKPALSDKQALRLAKIVVGIEEHYGVPCDIEWAFEADQFFITQSRPITTLHNDTGEKKHAYEFSWGERHSIISAESWLRGYISLRDVIGNENMNVFLYVNKGQVNTYNSKEDLPVAIESGREVLNHKFLKKHLKNTFTIREKFKGLAEKVNKVKMPKASDEELLSYFVAYQDLFDKTWSWFKVSQPEYLELAKEKLEELINERKILNPNEVFIILTKPTEIDLIKEEELAALKCSLGKVSGEKLLRHAAQYPWLCFNTYDQSTILKFLEKKFADLAQIPVAERRKKIESIELEIQEHRSNRDALLRELGSDSDVKYLSSVFGTLAVDRLRMKAWWGGAEYLFLPLFQEIAKRAGVSVEDLFMGYKIEDIIELLQNRNYLDNRTIAERKEIYAIAIEEGKMRFYEKDEAQDIFYSIIGSQKTSINSSDTIRGVIANTGKAEGRVKVIVVEDLKTLIADMDRFEKGDIMVTTMTQPTMVSLARKAAAIVTDEGGITSHAAILARECNIPCIVGTKMATQILKDGDIVEVDAEIGVVTIIERESD
ncbi:MAG: PEP/pyruvate-binding domain-containing protein [Patescibacteria group bacterium]